MFRDVSLPDENSECFPMLFDNLAVDHLLPLCGDPPCSGPCDGLPALAGIPSYEGLPIPLVLPGTRGGMNGPLQLHFFPDGRSKSRCFVLRHGPITPLAVHTMVSMGQSAP